MDFTRCPTERLHIESIASRLTPPESAVRWWLMDYTISQGRPLNLKHAVRDAAFNHDWPALVHGLIEKRAILADDDGNIT
jgi:hypothetical protein